MSRLVATVWVGVQVGVAVWAPDGRLGAGVCACVPLRRRAQFAPWVRLPRSLGAPLPLAPPSRACSKFLLAQQAAAPGAAARAAAAAAAGPSSPPAADSGSTK